MTRVEIDLNVRTRNNWTYTGIEDADGPVAVGDDVEVYEAETGASGRGRVEEVNLDKRLIYLSVAWSSISEPAMTALQGLTLGIRSSLTHQPGISASYGLLASTPVKVSAEAAVTSLV